MWNFRDLDVWQRSRALVVEVFDLTAALPRAHRYGLAPQLQRSANSIGANIAEAWHKRRYLSHFVSKLSDADAEQAETQHWLETALACGYLARDDHDRLLHMCVSVGRMSGRSMADPEKWCRRASSR